MVESITGHLSRRMLEHYSHIRLKAKKAALDRLDGSTKRHLYQAREVGLQWISGRTRARLKMGELRGVKIQRLDDFLTVNRGR